MTVTCSILCYILKNWIGESNSFEASTKCYKTFKNLTSSEPTAWWRMGRKDETKVMVQRRRTDSAKHLLQGKRKELGCASMVSTHPYTH